MERYLYEAVLLPNELGGYDARIPEFGLTTQGDDLGDAAFMAQDALALRISGLLKEGVDVAPVGRFDGDCPEDGMLLGLVVLAEAAAILDDAMTVQEAAETLDVSRSRIYAMIADGTLGSRKEGNMRLVSAQDVMKKFNSPRGAGRPRKEATMA